MKLSIVATLYKSSEYITEFCQRASAVAQQIAGDDYEIILVNDGSPDNSLELAVQASKSDPHIIVIDLSRNFGHHKAILAGLANASGEQVFLIDSDLEEEPEWLVEFFQEMQRKNCDVVFGIQSKRKGGIFERLSGWLFYKVFNSLTGLNSPNNPVTARLMSRRYVKALLLHGEREVAIGGLFLVTGFKQNSCEVLKHSTSGSTYSLTGKMTILVDSITSFSNKPLIGIFYIGFIILLLSSFSLVYLILNRLIFSVPLSGWTSVMVSIWFLGGLIVVFIGIIGIYISKIFTETKQRPNTIIRQIYTKNERFKGE